MAAIFHDWCNSNELRNYPLLDLVSRRADNGVQLPDDFLVDANIWIPKTAGTRVAVSSAAITPGLVTMTFVADGGGTPIPVAAVSVVRAASKYRKYQLQAFYPGVGGWVAFGSAVDKAETLSLVFSQFEQAELVPKVVRGYDDLPLQSIGKKDRAQALTGLVELRGGDDVEVLACTDDWPPLDDPDYIDNPRYKRKIDGEPRRCIAIRLIGDPQNYENLYTYTGPCEKAPESLQCGRRLIQAINGVTPDCNGNLTVEFKNIPNDTVIDDNDKVVGIALDYPLGLMDVCDANKGLVLPDPADLCAPSESSSSMSIFSSLSSRVLSSMSHSSMPFECPTIGGAYIETFNDGLVCWDFPYGTWTLDDCQLIGNSNSGWGMGTLQKTSTLGRDLQGFIKLQPGGAEYRGYLIFGYENPNRFWFLELDGTLGRVVIGRRNGPQVIEESLPYWTPIQIGEYIHVRVAISWAGEIQSWINGAAGPQVTAVPGTLANGLVGFATRYSVAWFDNLAFDWWTTDPAHFPPFSCFEPMSSLLSMSSLTGTGWYFGDAYLDANHGCQLAAYKMEEPVGTRYDALDNHFDLNAFNSPTRALGKDEYAASFAGSDYKQYLRHTGDVLAGRTDFTMSMWVNFNNLAVPDMSRYQVTKTWCIMEEADVIGDTQLYLKSNNISVRLAAMSSNIYGNSYTGKLLFSVACADPDSPSGVTTLTATGATNDVQLGWNHIMVSWNGTNKTMSVFVNGVQKLSMADGRMGAPVQQALTGTQYLIRHGFYVGGAGAAFEILPATGMDNDFLDGRIDELYLWDCVYPSAVQAALRLYNVGYGRYLHWTSAESSSSSALSSQSSMSLSSMSLQSLSSISSSSGVGPDADALFSAHFDIDESSARHAAYTYSAYSHQGPEYEADLTAFGPQALKIFGTGSGVQFDDSSDWSFGGDNFTLDLRWKPSTTAAITSLLGRYYSATNYFHFWYDNVAHRLHFTASSDAGTVDVSGPWTPVIDTWYHLAVVRNGATFYLFVDGVDMADTGNTGVADMLTTTVGRLQLMMYYNPPQASSYAYGLVNELRVSRSIARWTNTFTVPAAPYETDSYTKLLCHFNFDQTGRHAIELESGVETAAAVISFSRNRKYGTLALDPRNMVSDSTVLARLNPGDWTAGAGSYTAEAFVRLDTMAATSVFLTATEAATGGTLWQLAFNAATGLSFSKRLASAVTHTQAQGGTGTWATNTWLHVAVVRDASTQTEYLFVNGTLVHSNSVWANGWTMDTYGGACRLFIGQNGAQHCYGLIDEVFITRRAKWTSNFTPPSGPESP